MLKIEIEIRIGVLTYLNDKKNCGLIGLIKIKSRCPLLTFSLIENVFPPRKRLYIESTKYNKI